MSAIAEQSTQDPAIRLNQSMTEDDWRYLDGQVLPISQADELLREANLIIAADEFNQPHWRKARWREAFTSNVKSPIIISILPSVIHNLGNADANRYVGTLGVQTAYEAHTASSGFALEPLTSHAFQFEERAFAPPTLGDLKSADLVFGIVGGDRYMVEVKHFSSAEAWRRHSKWMAVLGGLRRSNEADAHVLNMEQKLQRFSELPSDRDSYGASPPTAEAIEQEAVEHLRHAGRPILASRVIEMLRDTEEDSDAPQVRLVSLKDMARILAEHKDFADPAVGLDERGVIHGQWQIMGDGLLVVSFLGYGEIILTAQADDGPHGEALDISEQGMAPRVLGGYEYLVPRR